ncbi:heavy-metal-associated domain-containing protein [Algoriphagus antarcticus]|uniref:Copper chaperone CopZ n=1 Tax=Algoriphagus antarcticus TaxID=238540 RepID=A0A3E0E392_9BACT|nr:heavy-metal-associated domain-containing protein [Algoriphagus antarcticus]REG92655.1 copper chaperone CopZ [Algoriphagus antarcticus]
MKTQKFKTNIACGNCLAKVTPILNAEPRINSWEVDLKSDDRLLTVESEDMSAEDVFKTVIKAGFVAKPQ